MSHTQTGIDELSRDDQRSVVQASTPKVQREKSLLVTADPWSLNDPALRRLGGISQRGPSARLPGGLRTRQFGITPAGIRSQPILSTSLLPDGPRPDPPARVLMESPYPVLPSIADASSADTNDASVGSSSDKDDASDDDTDISLSGSDDGASDDSDSDDSVPSPRRSDSSDDDDDGSADNSMTSAEALQMRLAVNKTTEQLHQAFQIIGEPLSHNPDGSAAADDDDDAGTEADFAEWERQRQENRDRQLESSLSVWSHHSDVSSQKAHHKYHKKLYKNLVRGTPVKCADRSMYPASVRVYLSAHVADHVAERRVLYHRAVPALQEFCSQRGLDFMLLDFHGDVGTDSGYSWDTLQQSRAHIRRSAAASTGPYFVGLIGDQYGPPLLPSQLPGRVYRPLCEWVDAHGTDPDGLVTTWYTERGQVYVLQHPEEREDEDSITDTHISLLPPTLQDQLSTSSWTVRKTALTALSARLDELSAAPLVSKDLGELACVVADRLTDTNKQLVLLALGLCEKLVSLLGPGIADHLQTLGPGLVTCIGDSNTQVQKKAFQVLNQCLEKTGYGGFKTLVSSQPVIDAFSSHLKNSGVRNKVLDWLSSNLLRVDNLTDNIDKLVACLLSTPLTWENAGLAAKLEQVIRTLSKWISPAQMEKYTLELDLQQKEIILKLLKNVAEQLNNNGLKTEDQKSLGSRELNTEKDSSDKTELGPEPDVASLENVDDTHSQTSNDVGETINRENPGSKLNLKKHQQEELEQVTPKLKAILLEAALALYETVEGSEELLPSSRNIPSKIEYFVMKDKPKTPQPKCEEHQLTKDDLLPVITSAIDQEIREALKCSADSQDRCLIYCRDIEGVPSGVTKDKVGDCNDPIQSKRLDKLKEFADKYSHPSNIHKHSVTWKDSGVNPSNPEHAKYLDKFCERFISDMKRLISHGYKEKTADLPREMDTSFHRELLFHNKHWQHLYEISEARTTHEKQACDFLKDPILSQRPLVIHGTEGSGKSCLAARIAALIPDWFGTGKIRSKITRITRFISRGVHSTTEVNILIENICAQICETYKISKQLDLSKINHDNILYILLNKVAVINAAENKKLFLIIDGLSDLNISNGGFLPWLPTECPFGVFIILTVNDGHIEKYLDERIYDNNCFIELENPEKNTHKGMPKLIDRNLTEFQTLMKNQTFKSALMYLSEAKDGLSEVEFRDLLSLNDDIVQAAYCPYSSPVNGIIQLPSLAFCSLIDDLSDYVGQHHINNRNVFCFKDSAYARETTKMLNSKDSDLKTILLNDFVRLYTTEKETKRLISLKNNNQMDGISLTTLQPLTRNNLRKLNNLNYYFCMLAKQQPNLIDELKHETLLNISWISLYFESFGYTSLLQQYKYAQELGDKEIKLLYELLQSAKMCQDTARSVDVCLEIVGRLPFELDQFPLLLSLRKCASSALDAHMSPLFIPLYNCLPPPGDIVKSDMFGFKALLNIPPMSQHTVLVTEQDRLAIWNNATSEVIHVITDVHDITDTHFFDVTSDGYLFVCDGRGFTQFNMTKNMEEDEFTPTFLESDEVKTTKESSANSNANDAEVEKSQNQESDKIAKSKVSMKATNLRLQSEITCITLFRSDPDISLIAGTDDGELLILDTKSKKYLASYSANASKDNSEMKENQEVTGFDGGIKWLRLSPDNTYLLAYCGDALTIWRTEDLTLTRTHTIQQASMSEPTFSSDGTVMACVNGLFDVNVLDLSNGNIMQTFSTSGNLRDGTVGALCFSHSGCYLAAGMGKFKVAIYDVGSEQSKTELFSAAVQTWHHVAFLAFDPTDQFLIGDGYHGHVKVWHIPSGHLYFNIQLSVQDLGWTRTLADKNSFLLYTITDKRFKILDLSKVLLTARKHYAEFYPDVIKKYELDVVETWKNPKEKDPPVRRPYSSGIELCQQLDKTMCKLSHFNRVEGTSKAYSNGNLEDMTYPQFDTEIQEALVLPNEQSVVSSCTEHLVSWDINTGKYVQTISSEKCYNLCSTPDSKYIIGKVASNGHPHQFFLKFWKANESVYKETTEDLEGIVLDYTISADGQRVYFIKDCGSLGVYDFTKRKVVRTVYLEGIPQLVMEYGTHMMVSSDEKYLLIGCSGSSFNQMSLTTFQLDNVHEDKQAPNRMVPFSQSDDGATGEKRMCLKPLHSACYDVDLKAKNIHLLANNTCILGIRKEGVKLLDIVSGQVKATMTTTDSDTQDVVQTCTSVNCEEKLVMAGTSKGSVLVWNLEEGCKRQWQLKPHNEEVLCCSWSSDSRYIFTGSSDHTIRATLCSSGVVLAAYNAHCRVLNLQVNKECTRVVALGHTGVSKRLYMFRLHMFK